jgi:hypothetical protein
LHNPGQPVVRPVQEVGLHDQQQALVLGALRRATGSPVSYAELRAAGVELPASVVSELELAGVPIERCRGVEGRGASVRLDPAFELTEEPTAEAQPPVAGHARPRPRALVPVALLAVIVAAGVLIATSLGGGGGRGEAGAGGPSRARVGRQPHANPVVAVRAPTTTATTPPPPPATPVSLDLATQLEAQGHGLLESGSYSGAVAVLRRALLATGEDVSGCVEPASTMCLTYAYALYDLGRALRLSGDPAAAVPVLERRLEIDNQRPTVLAELELARQGTT